MLALPPRDATEDQSTVPYELVRLLNDIPLPPAPGLPGSVAVDIVEANLRAFALRSIRLDASTDGQTWRLDTFVAQLPGNARLSLSGELSTAAGQPNFSGTLGIRTERLDALAQLWRRPVEGNPLFNLPGSFSAGVALVGETLSLSDGVLGIGDQQHAFSAEIGFEPATRHLNLHAALGTLDAAQSRALLALLPDAGTDGRFGVTFPKGEFEISAEGATVAGLDGRGLRAAGFWEGGVLALETLAAEDLGGVGFDAELTAFGSFARPELSGTASLSVASPRAPALGSLYGAIGTPQPVRDWLSLWMPAELGLELGAPNGEGGQSLAVSGRAGAADLRLTADLGVGIAHALAGRLSVRLDLVSDDPEALTAQLGLGDGALTPEAAPMRVAAVVSARPPTASRPPSASRGRGVARLRGQRRLGDLRRLSGNGNLHVSLSTFRC